VENKTKIEPEAGKKKGMKREGRTLHSVHDADP
jgi:hypothetical protein